MRGDDGLEFGIPLMDTHAFAEEIYSRAPRQSFGLNQYQKQEREVVMLARKQKSYTILKGDDDSDDESVDKSSVTTTSSRRSDNHKKRRLRKKIEVQDDQDNEMILRKESERQVKRRDVRWLCSVTGIGERICEQNITTWPFNFSAQCHVSK